ncbi:phosphate ABC transporter permease subunit PstC, partial [bacterium]|nr:phosphate ABC transporter permease subunit PstC [bacterium]
MSVCEKLTWALSVKYLFIEVRLNSVFVLHPTVFAGVLAVLIFIGFRLGQQRSLKVGMAVGGVTKLHSRPVYYGLLTALWCGLPATLLYGVWLACEERIVTLLVVSKLPESLNSLSSDKLSLIINDLRNLVAGTITASPNFDAAVIAGAEHYRSLMALSHAVLMVVVLVLVGLGTFFILGRIKSELRARNQVEMVVKFSLVACSSIAVVTTVGIVLSVVFEALRFFNEVPVVDFIFGLKWSPQTAIRADQVGSSGAFGAIPVFTGTLMIALIAMLVSVPLGLMSAIYLSEYATRKVRTVVKPLLEILAGIPTVIYGFFAALTVAPLVRDLGALLGIEIASESALVAGVVMGVMIIPFISSISDDVINAVPQSLRDGSYGLGATHSETIRRVVLPAALPGIVGGVLLAASRAIGETMIVVMAAGLSANLTANPFQAVTTVTVQIVTLLVGDQEFDSPKTLVAFA